MTNETTASQPKSIGDDAQFHDLLAAYVETLRKTHGYVPAFNALAAYIDSRAPAAQASATIQAGWQAIETAPEVKGDYFFCLITWGPEGDQNCGEGMRWKGRWFAAPVFHAIGQDRKYAMREVEVKPTHWMPSPAAPDAATIQEPVMVAEPVAWYADTTYDLNEDKQGDWPVELRSHRAFVFGAKRPTSKWDWKPLGDLSDLAAPMVADPADVALTEAQIAEIYEQATSYPLSDDDHHGAIAFARRIIAATVKAVPSEALDEAPLDTKLPCDVVIGGMTIRKGVRLGTLVGKAQRDNARLMELLPKPTPEQIAAFNALLPDQEAANFAAPLADKTGGGE